MRTLAFSMVAYIRAFFLLRHQLALEAAALRQQLVVVPSRRLEVSSDPDDNRFPECADADRADYLVTGNLRHFPRFWKKTKIITPRELIGLVAPHLITY
jgi:predicted nucleic acid-binding protein